MTPGLTPSLRAVPLVRQEDDSVLPSLVHPIEDQIPS
jgi:hypothetical protein